MKVLPPRAMPSSTLRTERKPTVAVVGHGMVGHKLVEALVETNATDRWDIVVFGEEGRPAYDRVGLSSLFTGTTAEGLSLVEPRYFDRPGLVLHIGDRVTSIDRTAQRLTSERGVVQDYETLILVTGSYPFVPPVPGRDVTGCFVYRTIDDLEAIRSYAASCRVGTVIGGGLLGLEAGNALRSLGLETHIVEFAPRLMPVQVDDAGGGVLRQRLEDLGVVVHTSTQTTDIVATDEGRVRAIRFADGAPSELATDMVVFSAGIRPRDDLARSCGLDVGERGGIVVDDHCRTSDPHIFAIGECALVGGRIYGLVGPGYQMARTVAQVLTGADTRFTGADCSTKLKLMGVDVASFGDAHGADPGARSIQFTDAVSQVHKRLVVDTAGRLTGGVLVGDASGYNALAQMARGDLPTPEHPETLLLPATDPNAEVLGVDALAGTATICSCENVTKHTICAAIAGAGLTEVGAVKAATGAGTGCGGCVPVVSDLLRCELRRSGVTVTNDLCEHFAFSRQELFDLIRVGGIISFSDLVTTHGRGRGCEICKPAVASMLASLGSGYVLEGELASLQDTNDHFLANLQRDGTYSVVPRIPGGEITPDKLIAIGEVARDFGLYTKITGGQRIDLFGARVEQLPAIWRRLIDAGFESGHAYGKALRTVKSCVGRSWCRYGVQDSTSLAIELELRYRGLRAPHKIKSAVSGCARECAEAQSKDFGVIATEKGWNLYVCGNGGMRPQHAVMLASDVDRATLIRLVDRFLMFYIRTADRLHRTSTWLNGLEGGIDYLRRVVVDDALGIGADLEAAMAAHVAGYECEWKATIDNPDRARRFHTFINTDAPDHTLLSVEERGQRRPAYSHEKLHLVPSGGPQ